MLARLGIAAGASIRVRSASGEVVLPTAVDDGLPAQTVRVVAGHAATINLGALNGVVNVERA